MTSIRNGEVVNYCALNRIFSSLAPFHFCGANGSFSCVLRHFSFYRFLSLHSFTCVNPLLLVFLVFSFFLPFSLSLPFSLCLSLHFFLPFFLIPLSLSLKWRPFSTSLAYLTFVLLLVLHLLFPLPFLEI